MRHVLDQLSRAHADHREIAFTDDRGLAAAVALATSSTMATVDLPLVALEQALAGLLAGPAGDGWGLIHHSDRGAQ